MSSMLSFEQAPPLSVPMRFFLTAPALGMLAGALLLWEGPDALQSRWAPATLALTHLVTAGFMLQVMCGALLQFIPVAAGGNIWRPRLVANLVHPAISLAVILFAAAFTGADIRLLDGAAALFVAALGVFVIFVGYAIVRTDSSNPTVHALRLALAGLVVTMLLGGILVQAVQGRIATSLVHLTNLHASWGLVGWVLVLVTGVAFFLVPMFQMTPPYPDPIQRFLPKMLFAVLVLWSVQLAMDAPESWQDAALAVLMMGASVFAGTTLWLQRRRKRKNMEPALHFFQVSMLCILAAALSWLLLQFCPECAAHPAVPVWIGSLILFGACTSAICGMLYKIAPFALWMHLQQIDPSFGIKLNTRALLPESPVRLHFRAHCLAIGMLLTAVFVPPLAHLAGGLTAASYAWLYWNLVTLVRKGLEHQAAYESGEDAGRASALRTANGSST